MRLRIAEAPMRLKLITLVNGPARENYLVEDTFLYSLLKGGGDMKMMILSMNPFLFYTDINSCLVTS